jgi:hypothetical protein
MKKLFIYLPLIFWVQFAKAQNVGIGTTTPSASAQLDVSSTTRGMLIPRMTSAQRNAIASPAAGLMVYDTNLASFYFYNGSVWSPVNTGGGSSQWTSNGNNIYNNNAGNVGIGTISPEKKFHVNGNILVNGRVDADGVIQAGGISSTGALYVSQTSLFNGAITGSSTASFAGNINSNISMSINDASAILQLRSGSVDKGFVQLSGDNLRIGTNSGNTAGNIVFRNDGGDIIEMKKTGSGGGWLQINNNGVSNGVLQATSTGALSLSNPIPNEQLQLGGEIFIDNTANHTGIGTASPTERLHVNGNVLATGNGSVGGDMVVGNGRLTSNVTTSTYNLLPVCYGRVSAEGNKSGGTPNFTCDKYNEFGVYNIYSSTITASSIILINGNSITQNLICSFYYQGTGNFRVTIRDEDGDGLKNPFNFVIFTP